MPSDLLSIGWRPTLAGCAVLIVSAIAGWGMGAERGFPPVHLVRMWVERVILPAVGARLWGVRTLFIFVNNSVLCALVVLCGGWLGGAWGSILAIGLAMGIGLRTLGECTESMMMGPADSPAVLGPAVRLGFGLNMLEVPALVVTMGLSMGQQAAPNGLPSERVWLVFALWVVPTLALAAAGEALWIGKLMKR